MHKKGLYILGLLLALTGAGAKAGTYTLLSLQEFRRSTGAPVAESVTFPANDTASVYTVNLYNGGQGAGETVSSAVIMLNGSTLFTPGDFNKNVTFLTRSVTLQNANELTAELRGKPGGVITLEIIGVDNDAPLISAHVEPAANAAGWYSSDVTVSFQCSDVASGIAVCPDAIVAGSEGANQTISGTARDQAGNEATASVTLNIDKTPPTINPQPNPPANQAGWNSSTVTVGFDCQDVLSGMADCSAPVTLTHEGAGQTASGSGRDIAGNTAEKTLTVNLDQTPPTITTQFSAQPNSAGWYSQAVTLSFTCNDALSGVQSCPAAQTVSGDGQNLVITVTAEDIAGNGAGQSHSLNIDTTPPVIQITAPAPDTELPTLRPVIELTVADNLILNTASLALIVNGQPFPGQCELNNDAVTCTPDSDLPRGDIHLQAGIADLAGNVAGAQIDFRIQDDNDGDGVPDNQDQCPDTPAGEAADVNGCSASQRDSDNDGVTDNLDLCPDTLNAFVVDANGCAAYQRDADGDGVSDADDIC
ncbi:MAG TPA: Ig-like domain-containing protein, partial [Gammaproteobacteria bacterium]